MRRMDRTGAPTGRSVDVLRLLAFGLTNSEIGGELKLAEATVKWHVSRLLLRYGTPNRAGLVREAIAQGHLSPDGSIRTAKPSV